MLAVSPHVFEQAFASFDGAADWSASALPPGRRPDGIPIFQTVLKGISVIGSIVGTRQDLAEVFALHALGRTRVIAETRKPRRRQRRHRRRPRRTRPARLVFDYATVPAAAAVGRHPSVDLYWLPLGAGDSSRLVRWSGLAFEAITARHEHREPLDLYHSALEVHLDGARFVIEMTPVWRMELHPTAAS